MFWLILWFIVSVVAITLTLRADPNDDGGAALCFLFFICALASTAAAGNLLIQAVLA